MKKNRLVHIAIGCLMTMLVFSACRPPLKGVNNKSNYYKSTKPKNALTEKNEFLTYGTFVAIDRNCNQANYLLVKLNINQTIQLSNNIDKKLRPMKLDNSSLFYYLENSVSYYYFVDRKTNILTFERFEYWGSPWWNCFVQTDHYLTEKFIIKGDTLINMEKGRFTRFCKKYVLDRELTANYSQIENEFIKK
jgi:hypothetical protein